MNTPFDQNDRLLQTHLLHALPKAPDAAAFQEALPDAVTPPSFFAHKKYFAVCCAALAILVTTALAFFYSSYSRLIDDVQPAFTDYLVPVELSYEENGIRMEVVAVHAYQNDFMAYVTLQDLTGDRVNDRMISHMDFFSVSGGSVFSSGLGAEHYDAESGIITYLVTA